MQGSCCKSYTCLDVRRRAVTAARAQQQDRHGAALHRAPASRDWRLHCCPASSEAYPVMVPHSDNDLFILSGCNFSRDGKLQNFSPTGLLLPLCCGCTLLLIPYSHLHLCNQSDSTVSDSCKCTRGGGQAGGVKMKRLKEGAGVGIDWGGSE